MSEPSTAVPLRPLGLSRRLWFVAGNPGRAAVSAGVSAPLPSYDQRAHAARHRLARDCPLGFLTFAPRRIPVPPTHDLEPSSESTRWTLSSFWRRYGVRPCAGSSASGSTGGRRPSPGWALIRSRSALVLGPPGSGKTTLLSHIAEAAGDAAAWYRVGTEDDDEIALTRHLGHTLGAALRRAGA